MGEGPIKSSMRKQIFGLDSYVDRLVEHTFERVRIDV
jgi:hypothetical protein